MANLVGTDVAANYLKAAPATNFGTRELVFLQVDMGTDVATNHLNSDSLFAKAIRGIQSVCEMYAVGTPNGNWFTAVVAATTAPLNDGQTAQDGDSVTAIKDAVDAATGANCTVWNALLSGQSLENNC